MNLMLNSFWRAAAYCLHPRVIALSLLPLLVMVGLALGLGYFFWLPTLDWVRVSLDSYTWLNTFWAWLENIGLGKLKAMVVPLIVIAAVTPLIAIASLIMVSLMMTPAMVALVAERRFPKLERKNGASFARSVAWSLGSMMFAIFVLLVSVPLWFIPPLILILPPLIWGWLTYRVMSFDALASHASSDERKTLMKKHRGNLLVIGVISGFLGAAPSLVWASGALFAVLFAVLLPVAVWIYTLVFGFASLWFSHYCLAALAELRNDPSDVLPPLKPMTPMTPMTPTTALPPASPAHSVGSAVNTSAVNDSASNPSSTNTATKYIANKPYNTSAMERLY